MLGGTFNGKDLSFRKNWPRRKDGTIDWFIKDKNTGKPAWQMIQFTDKARRELIKTLKPEEMVRVAVQGGGCSGMSYSLSIENETDEDDFLLDIIGVKVYIDPYSSDILKNTTVDYQLKLQQRGFVFSNPDANTTCGCGSSFS